LNHEDLVASDEKQPSYFRNWVSIAGTIFSVISFVVIFCLFLLDFFGAGTSPYLGIITYMLAPAVLIFSLILIPVGAWIERSQRRKRGYVPKFPIIDFNNPVHQRWTYTTWGVLTVFLLFSAIGVYRAYNFTESNTFCGTLCHTVMEPEYTAYHQSSHARVNCVQ
jgi:MFS-type transporter involved in bile tolerance (Atg22 family)